MKKRIVTFTASRETAHEERLVKTSFEGHGGEENRFKNAETNFRENITQTIRGLWTRVAGGGAGKTPYTHREDLEE